MKSSSEKKWVRIPSALPLYITGGVILLWSLITPIYKLAYILIGAALAVAAYLVSKKIFPGRCEVVVEHKYSGDKEMDEQIDWARGMLGRFRMIADKPENRDIKSALDRIHTATEAIIEDVIRDPSGRNETYTFFSYYLPTLDKLLSYHETFTGTGENVVESKRRVRDSLDMVAEAFEKQQDKMYKNEAMDIQTDIAVMESLLASEGLLNKDE